MLGADELRAISELLYGLDKIGESGLETREAVIVLGYRHDDDSFEEVGQLRGQMGGWNFYGGQRNDDEPVAAIAGCGSGTEAAASNRADGGPLLGSGEGSGERSAE
jgi:hypothetical protein